MLLASLLGTARGIMAPRRLGLSSHRRFETCTNVAVRYFLLCFALPRLFASLDR